MSEPTETPAAPSPVAKSAPASAPKANNKAVKTTWQCSEFYDADTGLTVNTRGVWKDDEPHSPSADEVKALQEKARASRIRLVEEGDDD